MINHNSAEIMKILVAIFFFAPILVNAQQPDDEIRLIGFEKQVRVDVSDRNSTDLFEAQSNCSGDITMEFEDKEFSGGCAGTIERTFKFTDDCGNEREATQYLTLVDDTPPVFSAVPEKEVFLESKLDLQKANSLYARDDSGAHIEVHLTEESNVTDDTFEIIRTWKATDACDNTTEFQQRVIVNRVKTKN